MTITFMFVGWFWSLAWGIYMIILSSKYYYTNNPKLSDLFTDNQYWRNSMVVFYYDFCQLSFSVQHQLNQLWWWEYLLNITCSVVATPTTDFYQLDSFEGTTDIEQKRFFAGFKSLITRLRRSNIMVALAAHIYNLHYCSTKIFMINCVCHCVYIRRATLISGKRKGVSSRAGISQWKGSQV